MRTPEADKSGRKAAIVIIFIIIVISVAIHLAARGEQRINVSESEVKLRMEYSGYTEVKLGETVSGLDKDIFGPCLLFTATNEYRAKVRGGFCTPKFSAGEIVITSRVIENPEELIEGSYQR